jgi:hypothetical protein
VRVAGQIGKHGFRAGEWRLRRRPIAWS